MIAQPFAQCNQQKKSRLENNQTAFIVSLQQNYTTIKKTDSICENFTQH